MLKYLRIAVTVFSLATCLLLIVLWVRSFYFRDVVFAPFSHAVRMMIRSEDGQISPSAPSPGDGKSQWTIKIFTRRLPDKDNVSASFWKGLRFGAYREHPVIGLFIPYWFPVLLTAALAVAPWIKWRFSIRTLMIGVAVVSLLLFVFSVWLRNRLG